MSVIRSRFSSRDFISFVMKMNINIRVEWAAFASQRDLVPPVESLFIFIYVSKVPTMWFVTYIYFGLSLFELQIVANAYRGRRFEQISKSHNSVVKLVSVYVATYFVWQYCILIEMLTSQMFAATSNEGNVVINFTRATG